MQRRFGGILVVSLFLGLVLGLAPRPAHACICASPPDVQSSVQFSDMVFSGRVVSVEEPPSGLIGLLWPDAVFYGRKVTFEVTAVWKGTPRSQVVVYTGRGNGDCGYAFPLAGSYLVYAGGDPLRTGTCTRTAGLDGAQGDLAVLGPGTPPPLDPVPPALIRRLGPALTCLGPLLLGLGGGLFLFVRRRRARRLA